MKVEVLVLSKYGYFAPSPIITVKTDKPLVAMKTAKVIAEYNSRLSDFPKIWMFIPLVLT